MPQLSSRHDECQRNYRVYLTLAGLSAMLAASYVSLAAANIVTIFNHAGSQQSFPAWLSGHFFANARSSGHSPAGLGWNEIASGESSAVSGSDNRASHYNSDHQFNSSGRGSSAVIGKRIASAGQAVAKMITVNDNKYGVWGYGPLAQRVSLDPYADAGIALSGYHLTVDWSALQPVSAAAFDWSAIDGKLDQLDEQPGLRYSIEIHVGQNSPQWVMDAVGYFTTTDHVESGPYPNYLSPAYQQYYYAMLEAVAGHIRTYSVERRRKIIHWQIAEGSTGDTGPYHGDMSQCFRSGGSLMTSCATYAISDAVWTDFRIQTWHQVYDVFQPSVRLMFNAGNDGEDMDTVINNFPNSGYKSGDLSHRTSFDSEIVYFDRGAMFNDALSNGYRDRGEVQNIDQSTYWQISPVKMSFVLITSALAGGLDMLNWTTPVIATIGNDARALTFFNKYSDYRLASTSNGAKRGFSALRDVIDFADTVRFPEATYGKLVADIDKNRYDNRLADDAANYGTDQPLYALYRFSAAKVDFMNPARIEAIKTAITMTFPTATWAPGVGGNEYSRDGIWHDYGIDMVGNYEKFVTQIDPLGTSRPRWRVGANYDVSGNDLNDSQMYGRYAREFKLVAGKGTMYFNVDPGLANASAKNKANISVTYFDEGMADWSITAFGAKLAVKNTNSKQFVTKTLTVSDFKFGGKLLNASDFMLEHTAGGNFAVALVEFENTSKVATPGPKLSVDPASLKS